MAKIFKQPFDSVSELAYPGVFVIECLPKKKAYFHKCKYFTWTELQQFFQKLTQGSCTNPELLADYQTSGFENFRVDVIETSPDYLFEEDLLESAFLRIKNSWHGEFY